MSVWNMILAKKYFSSADWKNLVVPLFFDEKSVSPFIFFRKRYFPPLFVAKTSRRPLFVLPKKVFAPCRLSWPGFSINFDPFLTNFKHQDWLSYQIVLHAQFHPQGLIGIILGAVLTVSRMERLWWLQQFMARKRFYLGFILCNDFAS